MSRPHPRNPAAGRSRRLAEALGAYVRRIAPVARRDWADAMGAEIASIDSPRAALAFALGCVWASYRQRLADPATLVGLARWGVAGTTALLAALVWRLAGKLLSGAQDAAWATTA